MSNSQTLHDRIILSRDKNSTYTYISGFSSFEEAKNYAENLIADFCCQYARPISFDQDCQVWVTNLQKSRLDEIVADFKALDRYNQMLKPLVVRVKEEILA